MNTLSSLLKFIGNRITPVGTVAMFAGSSAPNGWLLCRGQAVSRTTYSALFSAIGTTYGAGDGSTTFNLPDLRNRVAVGAGDTYSLNSKSGANTRSYTPAGTVGNHTLTLSQIPSHNHNSKTLTGYFDLRRWEQNGSMVVNNSGIVSSSSVPNTSNAVKSFGSSSSTAQRITVTATHTHDSQGGGGAHKHGFTGTAANIDVRQPYIGVNFIIYTGVA